MKPRFLTCLMVLLLLQIGLPAEAALCTLTTTGLRFGVLHAYSVRGAEALAGLLVQCRGTPGEIIHLRMRPIHTSGVPGVRLLTSGRSTLAYNLYLDAARSRLWGDGTNNTEQVSDTRQLAGPVYSHLYPVFARLVALPVPSAQPYVDDVIIELDY